MALLESRPRAGYTFLAVVIGHLVLISAQVTSKSGVPVLETITMGTLAEIQRGTAAALGGVRSTWSGYVALRGVQAENEALRNQIAQVQVDLQQQRALADRTRSLEAILNLRSSLEVETTAARIIGAAASPELRTVTIDKGSTHGIKVDMAVIAPGGVVGRVVVAGSRASRVQLIVDRNAAAGALVERSRAQGVAVGVGDGRLRLDYVSQTADITPGDTLVTSGIDGIYPKGFVIGRVDSVQRVGAYPSIAISPAVDFSLIEDVLVVLTPTEAEQAGVKSE
ncbi:MAG: rod shape-determining protein MreC [Vicinamibacterales bacterium]